MVGVGSRRVLCQDDYNAFKREIQAGNPTLQFREGAPRHANSYGNERRDRGSATSGQQNLDSIDRCKRASCVGNPLKKWVRNAGTPSPRPPRRGRPPSPRRGSSSTTGDQLITVG